MPIERVLMEYAKLQLELIMVKEQNAALLAQIKTLTAPEPEKQ